MKTDTRSANVGLAELKHRLTLFQSETFERGTNYGVMLAMQAMGVDKLTVEQSEVFKMAERDLKVRALDPSEAVGWEFEIR